MCFRQILSHRLLTLMAFLIISGALTGCLVEDAAPAKTIYRTTDEVRAIVSGDYFEYNVEGKNTTIDGYSQSFTGTLRIEYYTDSLIQPTWLGGGSISVIREETTLTIGTSYTTTRYIQQNVDGSLQVVAANVGGTLYRTGPEGGNNSTLEPIIFLESPVPQTDTFPLNHQYLEGCESGTTCTQVVTTIAESVSYQGSGDVTTNKGKFNALRYDYSGVINPAINPFTALFDFRGACNSSTDSNAANYYGYAYVFPEVGTVFIDQGCTASTGSHDFRAYLTTTNVAIPDP